MQLFVHLAHALAQPLNRLVAIIGRAVAWLTLAMVAVASAVVVARAFGAGSIAAQELVTYLHALVLTLASAYTLQANGHVRVDVFYRRLDAHGRAWVDSLGHVLFLLPVALFIVWVSFPYVAAAWSIREGSADAGGLPAVFLLKTLVLATGLLLALQALADLLLNLCTLSTREVERD